MKLSYVALMSAAVLAGTYSTAMAQGQPNAKPFDQIQQTAPRSPFDQIQETAPKADPKAGGTGLVSAPGSASQGSTAARAPFDQIQESAPRAPFDQIQESAPRAPFDQIQETAPRAGTPVAPKKN